CKHEVGGKTRVDIPPAQVIVDYVIADIQRQVQHPTIAIDMTWCGHIACRICVSSLIRLKYIKPTCVNTYIGMEEILHIDPNAISHALYVFDHECCDIERLSKIGGVQK